MAQDEVVRFSNVRWRLDDDGDDDKTDDEMGLMMVMLVILSQKSIL